MTRKFSGGGDVNGGSLDDDDRRVVVASEPYSQFSAWIDRDLEKLVARWSHWAAPNAGQPRRKMLQLK